jgi:phage/plasmid-like protein (TIGR03299 family)
MMYVKQRPWHGLGAKLETPPTSAEAIKAAGLNWQVLRVPTFARFRLTEEYQTSTRRDALMPSDRIDRPDCPIFGVVGDDYQIMQNHQAFQFFDPFIRDGLATYETAGALGEGERVWVLAKMKQGMNLGGIEEVEKYLLPANAHTGKGPVPRIQPVFLPGFSFARTCQSGNVG